MSTDTPLSSRIVAPSPLTSQRQMRDLNSSVVLTLLWDAPTDTGLTASEIVEKTNLTRATVLSICGELKEQNWVTEDRAPSEVRGRGRQARRFTFNRRRHLIAAADIGFRSTTSVIADLKGTVLGRGQRVTVPESLKENRTDLLISTLDEALHDAYATPEQIDAACIGVAVPVTHDGTPYPSEPTNPFWENMRIDQQRLRSSYPTWHTYIENDANLAALAEGRTRSNLNSNTMVTLLAGQRLGAGIIINGELFRGVNGGAGEMGYLENFTSINTELSPPIGSLGIIGSVHKLLWEARQKKKDTTLWEIGTNETNWPDLDDVWFAAQKGDNLAKDIVKRVSDHLTAAILTLSNFIDPGLVVIAGGAAEQAIPLLPDIRTKLAKHSPFPSTVEISILGRDVVLTGAIHNAIQQVRLNASES
ncbi:MAG: ROK family transcriptional regulator [Ancrocorticia sp.]